MLGPLPPKYRLAVWMLGLAAFAGLAVIISPAVAYSTVTMALFGLAVGTLVVVLYLRDFEHGLKPRQLRRLL